MARGRFIAYGISTALLLSGSIVRPQNSIDLMEYSSSSPVPEDGTKATPDSTQAQVHEGKPAVAKHRIDAGYHTPPVHPYFRDEYRFLQDLRRLVYFVERRAIRGMESVPELVEIVREFPEEKQTEVIQTAVLCGAVNFVSEEVSRSLRKHKLPFIQWQLEKIILQKNFSRFSARAYNGLNASGFRLYLPSIRFSYSHRTTKYFAQHSLSYFPTRNFGLSYTLYDGRTILGSHFRSRFGNLGVSYDETLRILMSGFRLRRPSFFLIRIVYINYLAVANADYLKGELLVRW